jgi:hypothetical protein
VSLFLSQSAKGAKRIENAGAFGSRHRECGIQAGFPVAPTIHDWRAEGLLLAGMYRSLSVVATTLTVVKTSITRQMRGLDGMFEVANLRSPARLQVIHDTIELCEKEGEVEFCPGELDRCCCKSSDNAATDDCLEKKLNLQERTYKIYGWKHIYKCFQMTQERGHGLAELCFICSEWFFNTELWELHCQDHVNDMEYFPIFLDPLVLNGVLAMLGFCYDYLMNPKLPASHRCTNSSTNRSGCLTFRDISMFCESNRSNANFKPNSVLFPSIQLWSSSFTFRTLTASTHS